MQSGPAIKVWFTTSGVGVRIAAMMKLIRIAYFRFFDRNWGVTIPSMDRSVITTGSSKTTPKARVNLVMKSMYAAMEIMGSAPFSMPKLSRNCTANGITTSSAKAPPSMNSSEPTTTKGTA
jgi:hypothetical protein